MSCPNFAAANGRAGAPTFLVILRTLALAGTLAGAGCGEELPSADDAGAWGDWGSGTDAAAPPQDSGAQVPPPPQNDAGASALDAGAPPQDSGSPADSGVTEPPDDAGVIPLDDASVPPPEGGGKWTLKAGSAPECPEEPPPIPLLGGLCLGIYWSCGWENELGQQYSCVCDWVHYLCLPL